MLFRLLSQVELNPDLSKLPGETQLKDLANGLGAWALVAAMVGMVIGAVAWAFGQHSQNYHQAYSGRKGVIISGAAALLIGASPHIIIFFNNIGQLVR